MPDRDLVWERQREKEQKRSMLPAYLDGAAAAAADDDDYTNMT